MRLLVNFLFAFTTLMCCHVSGLDEEHLAAYDRLVECMSLGTRADLPDDRPPVKTAIYMCDAFKGFTPCVTKPLNSPGSNTEILDFYRAFQLQLNFLANKMNMCGEPLPYKKLKELVEQSENDDYVPCAGEISMKCYTAGRKVLVGHGNDLRMYQAYIECYEQESSKCDFPIARHMNTVVQAQLRSI